MNSMDALSGCDKNSIDWFSNKISKELKNCHFAIVGKFVFPFNV